MAKIIIDLSKCHAKINSCAKCIEECPMQIIDRAWFSQNGNFVYEDDQCIECRNCEVTCPEKAFEVISTD